MGFRFSRRLKLMPGVTLNFSKSGISTTFGGKGFKHTVGKNGSRTTVSLPGTGVSYTVNHGQKSKTGRSFKASTNQAVEAPSVDSKPFTTLEVAVGAFVVSAILFLPIQLLFRFSDWQAAWFSTCVIGTILLTLGHYVAPPPESTGQEPTPSNAHKPQKAPKREAASGSDAAPVAPTKPRNNNALIAGTAGNLENVDAFGEDMALPETTSGLELLVFQLFRKLRCRLEKLGYVDEAVQLIGHFESGQEWLIYFREDEYITRFQLMMPFSAKGNRNFDKIVYITNGETSPDAIEYAQQNQVILLDGNELMKLFREYGLV